MMRLRDYTKYIPFLKSIGLSVTFTGSCWLLYQLHEISEKIQSALPIEALNFEQYKVQYIYIDDPCIKADSIYQNKETLRHSLKDEPLSFSYLIIKFWKSLNQKLMYRLLHMAQHGSREEKEKAIYSLNCLQHLKDWHYRNIAQMLDAKTAVSLARMPHSDLRFFLKPPYYHEQNKLHDLIEKLHQLLMKLEISSNSCHPCLKQFLNNKFKDFHRGESMFDHDLVSEGMNVVPEVTWDLEFLLKCLEALYHHSSLEKYSKDVIEVGSLAVLISVGKLLGDNLNINTLLANIISNLSLQSEYLDDIFRSGWIGILAKWLRDKDIRLASCAAKALANLDLDNNEGEIYPQWIYPLYPLYKTQIQQRKMDIIFIHGLLGGVFVTWRQRDKKLLPLETVEDHNKSNPDPLSEMIDDYSEGFIKDLANDLRIQEMKRIGHDFEIVFNDCPVNDNSRACGPFTCKGNDHCMQEDKLDTQRTQCWPKDWLSRDVPSIRIIGINYETNLSMWRPLCPIEGLRSTIKKRSDELVKKLALSGIGKRPVIWICHSMGGLLVKKMLVEEWKKGDEYNILKNTKGIVFFSTPHKGSRIAALTKKTEMLIWPSVEVKELREESPKLLNLHDDFLQALKEFPMEIISFGETKSTLVTALKFQFRFVNPESADPGVGEFFEIPQDHFSICKPANRQSFLYQKVLSIVKRNINS